MLTPNLSQQAGEFLSGLSEKEQGQIVKKMDLLCENPNAGDTIQLKGYDYLRTRCGDFRIVHDNDGSVLAILVIERRDDDAVYKELKRLYG